MALAKESRTTKGETTKGLDAVPSNKEALHLLEERKKIHIPDEAKRVIPSKKMEDKEEEKEKDKKKRKRESSSTESAAKSASAEPVWTAIPLTIRSVEEEVSAPVKQTVLGKGKEVIYESTPIVKTKDAVYNRREVVPFNPDTLFSELGYKGMAT